MAFARPSCFLRKEVFPTEENEVQDLQSLQFCAPRNAHIVTWPRQFQWRLLKFAFDLDLKTRPWRTFSCFSKGYGWRLPAFWPSCWQKVRIISAFPCAIGFLSNFFAIEIKSVHSVVAKKLVDSSSTILKERQVTKKKNVKSVCHGGSLRSPTSPELKLLASRVGHLLSWEGSANRRRKGVENVVDRDVGEEKTLANIYST